MLWLALQCPRLGLEVFEDADPAAPCVLLESNRVLLRNECAARAGILPGCTLATAHSIKADLKHFHRDEAKERERLQFLAEALYRFSARVSIEAPDGLLLEIGGSLRLFGDADELAREAAALCRALGHRVRARVAPTPLAALVMARANAGELTAVPLTLARLPASDKAVERFANMGLRTLGSLLALPPAELGQRCGPEILDYLARLTGRAPDPRRPIALSPTFDRALHLLEPVRDKDALLFPIQRLLHELSLWLVARQLGAEQLCWHFASAGRSTPDDPGRLSLPIRFARAQQDKQAFLDIVRLKLSQTELPADILSIRLEAQRLGPWLTTSHGLFRLLADESPDAPDLSELIDQLRARLGNRACTGIETCDQHAPEDAWRFRRPGSVKRVGRTTASAPLAQGSECPQRLRPLWLFDPPQPTERDRLTLLKGPERIQSAWWQQAFCRDYYVARLPGGAECWAFVDVPDPRHQPPDQTLNQRWFLHGYFA